MSFARQLAELLAEQRTGENRFLRNLNAGSYPRAALSRYAIRLARLVSQFPRRLAALAANCPERSARLFLLENMLEEEGVAAFHAVNGLSEDERASHTALALRFVTATGATEADVHAESDDTTETWFDSAVGRGEFLETSAYLNIGIEGAAPSTFEQMIPSLRDVYGFKERELTFFSEHASADERHSARAIAMLEQLASSPDERARVSRGIRRGVAAWRSFHRRCDREMLAWPTLS